MLDDPGPLPLFVDTEFPTPLLAAPLLGSIAEPLAQLGVAADGLASPAATLAGANGDAIDSDLGSALGALASEAAVQTGAVDGSLAGTIGNTDALEGDVVSTSNNLPQGDGGQLIDPQLPRGNDLPPDYAGDQWTAWDTGTIAVYQQVLHRGPTPDEMVRARTWFPDYDKLRAFLAGQGATGGGSGDGSSAPTPPSDDSFAAGVRALYQDLLGRTPGDDEINIHRGNPRGLDGVHDAILASDEYAQRHGG